MTKDLVANAGWRGYVPVNERVRYWKQHEPVRGWPCWPTIVLWILCGFLCIAVWPHRCAENWPQWRGPRGTGVSRESSVPVFWNEDREIAWKCPLPEWGNSTPADLGRFGVRHQSHR